MTNCPHETIVRVIGDPKSPTAHVCECGHVIQFGPTPRRCTILNGRRYIDGVDQGPVDPGGMTPQTRRSAQRGAERRGRKGHK